MTIIFFGNSKYSLLGLKIIQTSYPISLIVTNPGSPLSQFPSVLQTEKLDEKVLNKILNLKPDFLIVEDYGLILPDQLLAIPKIASLNIHHSLLPKYRGPSPAPTTILNGDKISGVTIIEMSSDVDAGDIVAQEKYTLAEDETTDSLLIKLNQLGAKLLLSVLPKYPNIEKIKQDHSQATFTKKITKQDGFFKIENPPENLDRMIRAYYPWPNVWTRWNNKIVKFYPENQIQMEGKKIMPLKDFLNGYSNFPLKFSLL